MKNLYNITKGQMAVLWLFAIVFVFYADSTYNDLLGAVSIALFFAVVFYTVGWRAHNKKG